MIRRREFTLVTGTSAALITAGCGGGGGGSPGPVEPTAPAAVGPTGTGIVVTAPNSPAQSGLTPEVAPATGPTIGTNFSGMEFASNLRAGPNTQPNINFTVAREADVAYLKTTGFTKNRLPIQWELLQPVLKEPTDTDGKRVTPNADSLSKIGVVAPGDFYKTYEDYITGVLDAHAKVGLTCIIDCHNYGRYRDFVYQPNGSVTGLIKDPNPVVQAWTTAPGNVFERIFALAPGATLTVANFVDFWRKAALRWKDHPGFGGYGLMNEPYLLPEPGKTVASTYGAYASGPAEVADPEDKTIWPAFAKAAIEAIRAIDPVTNIYLSGNFFGGSFTFKTLNPSWPLKDSNGVNYANVIYEVHNYLDNNNGGGGYDWVQEVAKGTATGTSAPVNAETGRARLKIATDYAKEIGVKLAIGETGMPIGDARWEESFRNMLTLARESDCEIYSWIGGNHWAVRNNAINHVPGWYQNRTVEPTVAGQMKAATGVTGAALFDEGPGWATTGPVTVTVYARGNLLSELRLIVKSDNGGTCSPSALIIPAGANGSATYTFTPPAGAQGVFTLSYSSDGQLLGQVPPARRVFSLADPVAYANAKAENLADGALAIIAKYSACKWEMGDGYTDYMQGVPSKAGNKIRAISDSGYGASADPSRVGNAMEMLNWINDNPGMGDWKVPVVGVNANGKIYSDHASSTVGFWSKRSFNIPVNQPNPLNKVPYNLEDEHFAIAVATPRSNGNGNYYNTGAVFEASKAESVNGVAPQYRSQLLFVEGKPQARWVGADAAATSVILTGAVTAPGVPTVLTMSSKPGRQQLRVNSTKLAAEGKATFSQGTYAQMLMGWGFRNFYPQDQFDGHIYAVITGKGVPSDVELKVLEDYLRTVAGIPAI